MSRNLCQSQIAMMKNNQEQQGPIQNQLLGNIGCLTRLLMTAMIVLQNSLHSDGNIIAEFVVKYSALGAVGFSYQDAT